ncbi:unnamed protein product [Rotaria magnacalcarata]
MFYTHAILTKRGPLARLWLAAHWDKKLTKAQIFETDIRLSCESILEPCLKLALRTKGHLLLGVVRIYSRKTKYLLADCNEAFIKIKMAFRPGIVGIDGSNNHNNPDADTREVSIAAITLPENFHDFDLIDLNIDYVDDPSRFQIHQARAEEITLKEDFVSVPMPLDDNFGDTDGIDEPEFFRKFQRSPRSNRQTSHMDLDSTNIRKDHSIARPFNDDPFALDGFGDFAAPPSVIGIGGDNSNLSNEKDQYDHVMSPFHQDENAPEIPLINDNEPQPREQNQANDENRMDIDATNEDLQRIPGADETTLLSNVSDEFILPPISTTAQAPAARQAIKRKRKLIVDEVKEIDSGSMKTQLSDTTDIVGVLELAPPTRRLMHLKETGGIEKLFSLSATSMYSKSLQQLFTRNLVTKPLDQMPPDNYQIQHDLAMEQLERDKDESSIDHMRGAHHHYLEFLGPDPSNNSPNRSKKRNLSPLNESNIDKRQRIDDFLPDDSLLFPPMTTSMDNLMDVIPAPMSPTRKSGRKVHELNQMPLSPSRTPVNSRRKKGVGHLAKENQEEQEDDDDEHGQTTTAQEDFESGKKLNRRAKIMLNAFERAFDTADGLSFHDHLSSGNPNYHTRKLTAQKFYTLLVLKKLQAVDVEQNQAFEDITVTPELFDKTLHINCSSKRITDKDMTSQPNKRQLVLFDGDNNRTALFDNIKQLSSIPPYCDFYIFCNGTDPIRSKIFDNLYYLSQVHAPNSSKTIDERLVDFLQKNLDEYSHIIVACGPKPTYEHVFQNIWKKYGKKKLYVMRVNKLSDITVNGILGQIRQHRSEVNKQASNVSDYSNDFNSMNSSSRSETNAHGSLLDEDLYLDTPENILVSKKSKANKKLIVQSEIRCRYCNEHFQSKQALKEHCEKDSSCLMEHYYR